MTAPATPRSRSAARADPRGRGRRARGRASWPAARTRRDARGAVVAGRRARSARARGALSTAWYCPGLPASFPTGDQTVTLSNLGSTDADAVVTVHPDDGADADRAHASRCRATPCGRSTARRSPVSRRDRSTERPRPRQAAAAGPDRRRAVLARRRGRRPGLETDDRARPGAVRERGEHRLVLRGRHDRARRVAVARARRSVLDRRARRRHAAHRRRDCSCCPRCRASTCRAGRASSIADRTIKRCARRASRSQVHADVGRVVASQTLQFGRASGPTGCRDLDRCARAGERSGGSPTARRSPGSSQWVAITDLGALDAQRRRAGAARLEGDRAARSSLTVPSGGVSWVQIGGLRDGCTSDCLRVPDERAATSSRSQSDADVPIVAQTLSRFGAGDDRVGRDDVDGLDRAGAAVGDRRARARVDERSTSISVMNTGVERRARLGARSCTTASSTGRPRCSTSRSRPNARFVLPGRHGGRDPPHDAAVVITSDVPIFVESTIYAAARRDPGARHPDPLTHRSPRTVALVARPHRHRVADPRGRRRGRVVARAPPRGRAADPGPRGRARSNSTGATSRGPKRRGSSCCSRRSTATRARACSTRRKPLESDDVSVDRGRVQRAARAAPALPDRRRADHRARRRATA